MSDAPFDRSLLPRSAAVDDEGRCVLGGIPLDQLAERFGTPLYVYDEAELRGRCREYMDAFPGGVAYASKAFLCVAMAKLVASEGLAIDVATGGELHLALHAGIDPAMIVFHGNNKSEAELERALRAGVGRVVADSFAELDRIDALVAGGLRAPAVMVRVTPGIEAHTHEYLETAVDDSKFGFGLGSGDALVAARRVIESNTTTFAGLHCHIGSQVFRSDSFDRALDRMVGLIAEIVATTGATVDELNMGGGLGVRYVAGDDPPTIAEHGASVHASLAKAVAAHGVLDTPRLSTEPGRSIAAPAGITLYRVGTIKPIPNVRTYVAVDGGMSDNLRPVTYGAQYESFVPARVDAPRPATVTIAGKHCEQGDLLVRDASVPDDLAVGEVLAVPVTGAYGHSMASNYNRVTRPAVVFVRDGDARVVVRRETEADLLAREEE
ncbi:MAG TPA: diaminopimelate decarboxylase [Acidimicrobiia bacterium]|nr:diaminopimelate decarboxylase [Acidimicrobiia bacterium]